MDNKINIFYACDAAFLKYTIVSLTSLKENASRAYQYCIHILHTGIEKCEESELKALEDDRFEIVFDDVAPYLQTLNSKLPIRDYYSKTTYFRLFIAEIFPMLKKALYVDSDTVVLGDISELFETELGDCLVGACVEQAMAQTDVFGTYAEKVVGVDRNKFFNAGVLLINCELFRKEKALDRFIELLSQYSFVVTQDEDYLNVICKDRVKYIDQAWNMETYGELQYAEEDCKLIHYIMINKPWHYRDCTYEGSFWKYAEKTSCYERILNERDTYPDEKKRIDLESAERLARTAAEEAEREDRYFKIFG